MPNNTGFIHINISFRLFLVIATQLIVVELFSQTLCQLKPQHCGQQMTLWLGNQGKVNSTYVIGATNYKYKAENIPGNTNYFSEKIQPALASTSTGSSIDIGKFLGMKDTTWYNISVSWSSDNGITWSPYGPSCQIKTCISQPTQLQTGSCGVQFVNWATNIYSSVRPYASQYRFRLKNLQGQSFFDQTIIRNVRYFKWSNFSNVPAGKTFECYVQWNNGGDWKPWGQMCYITSPQLTLSLPNMRDRFVVGASGMSVKFNTPILADQNFLSYTVGEPITFTFENTSLSKTITQGFQQPDKVIVSPIQPRLFKNQVIEHFTCYPNPFDTKITITSPTNFNQTVFVKIINELGSLIHEEKMDSNSLDVDLSTITIGRYHVIIANESGEIIESFSAVKFK